MNYSLENSAPTLAIHYDEQGRAYFRGNKAAALAVARAAIMDSAKVQGLVIDKVMPSDDAGNAVQPIVMIEVRGPEGKE